MRNGLCVVVPIGKNQNAASVNVFIEIEPPTRKQWRCVKCGCWMQTITLEGKPECSACGSRALEKQTVPTSGDLCLYCFDDVGRHYPAGSLCCQS